MGFHVPELFRVRWGSLASDAGYGNNGAFALGSPIRGWALLVIASDGGAAAAGLVAGRGGEECWEHVSVHAARLPHGRNRTPFWEEMCYVKDLFWDPEDVVIQYHPRRSEYVSFHETTLHLWRPVGVEIPTPPPILVGPHPGEDLPV